MVNNQLFTSLKVKLLKRAFPGTQPSLLCKKLTHREHILRSQRASKSRYAKIVPLQAFEIEDNILFSCDPSHIYRRKLSKDDLAGIYPFFTSDTHKTIMRQLALSIVRSYTSNSLSESRLRKLEDEAKSKAKISKHSDEIVRLLYRIMKTFYKERRQALKENARTERLRSNIGSTRTVNSTTKSAMKKSSQDGNTRNANCKESTTAALKPIRFHENKLEKSVTTHRKATRLGTSKQKTLDRCNGSRFNEVNEKHCQTVAKMVSDRLFGLIQTAYPSVQLFIQRSDDCLTGHQQVAISWSKDCLGAFFFPYNIKDAIRSSFVDNMREFVFHGLFKGCELVSTLSGRNYSFETFQARAVLAVASELSPLIKHKDVCLLDTLALIVGVPRESLVVVAVDEPRSFQHTHTLPFTSTS